MNIQDNQILFIRSLENYSNHEEALRILKKLASHVKPIMKKRNWRVNTLEEFFPAQDNLLGINVNHGEKICIRLRPHYDKGRFLDFNDLIGTMLHELTHIEISPHDATFYKLLDELNDEYDEILIKGEGFLSNGYRLGEEMSQNVPPALARQKALEAAEKRRKIDGIMTHGGKQLGGGGRYGLSLRELAAMAAERRRRDNFWCGGEQRNGNNNNGTSSVVKKPTAGRFPPNKVPGSSSTSSKPSPIKIPVEKLPGTNNSWETTSWTCSQCTFINRPMTLQCYVCLAERYDPPSQPLITIDDFPGPPHWSCPRCTFDNAPDIVMCLGCDYLKR
ncbi:WLM domain-containing protein [Glomus cerebriforme]|uniref:WLM domain-containing protein n=1 Tax=Glomus cerebriforme TaxID=658196 RepID=A0A397SXA0_9GLOM|nr:WLM domain-containing protein [Glomus cerebriforme]